MEVSGHLRVPAALLPGKETPSIHYTGGWMGSRVGLYMVAKGKILAPVRDQIPSHPAHS